MCVCVCNQLAECYCISAARGRDTEFILHSNNNCRLSISYTILFPFKQKLEFCLLFSNGTYMHSNGELVRNFEFIPVEKFTFF